MLREEPSTHKDEAIGNLRLDVFAGDIRGRGVSFHSGIGKESLNDAMDVARLPITTTCSQFHRLREKSPGLGRDALKDGPVSMCAGERARGERAGEGGGYASAQSLQHAAGSIGSARRVHSTVGLRTKIGLKMGLFASMRCMRGKRVRVH